MSRCGSESSGRVPLRRPVVTVRVAVTVGVGDPPGSFGIGAKREAARDLSAAFMAGTPMRSRLAARCAWRVGSGSRYPRHVRTTHRTAAA
jgi:hypothetical protein